MLDVTETRRIALARHLRKHLQGEVRFDPAARRLYSTDASIYQVEPLGVVLPKTVADVVAAVQIAGEMHVPLTARGGGTSLSGQSIGPGVVLDCSKYLHAILDVDPAARVARVQPGVVLDQLNRALAPHGLQFGPDVATASRANLGGMVGNNSAGVRSIVYGKTIDHVRRLGVVLADGSRIEPDAVVAATGYALALEPVVGHLGVLDDRGRPLAHGRRTVPGVPGLRFIGLANPLKGLLFQISLDARGAAAGIAQELAAAGLRDKAPAAA
jgi:FAD/FMN-containing dehydrogenase